jgi:hypothetical protein
MAMESDEEYYQQLIKTKTGVLVPFSDILACHTIRKKKDVQDTFVVRIIHHKSESKASCACRRT